MFTKKPHSYQPIELFNRLWTPNKEGAITFLLPPSIDHPDIALYHKLIPPIEERLQAIDGIVVPQYIVFCPADFYWERFLEKARRSNFDPSPWSWSEGDVDNTPLGRVFCVKLGAEFECESERRRFIAHELDHPHIKAQAPCIEELLADAEGIVEADARIALEIQNANDMTPSTRFITNLLPHKLIPATELNSVGYDHPSFFGKRPSESEGYASSFLWFFGLSLKVAELQRANGTLKDTYLAGRSAIINIARNSGSTEEYKAQLLGIGLDYDALAKERNILIRAQEIISKSF